MSKAGPLTRSRSKRTKPTSSAAGPPDRPSLEVESPPQRSLDSGDIVIGLALGSPGQSPLPPLPPDDRNVGVCQKSDPHLTCKSPNDVPGALGTITEIDGGQQGIKRKGSRWKTFGSFFGRKDSATRAPENSSFYQLDNIPEQGLGRQHIAHNYLETNALRRKRADSSRSNRTGTDSSNSTTRGENSGLLRKSSSRRKVPRRKQIEEIKPETLRLHSASSAHANVENLQAAPLMPPTALRQPGASLLQVEIPNVELERYSVMFGDVLDSKPQAKIHPKTQPSLMIRRQGHVEELQAVPDSKLVHTASADDLPKPPHRRDDSVSSKCTKSPSFSLFPSSTSTPRHSANSTASKILAKPSPLSRSTTAPNLLSPPDRPQSHKSKSQDQDHVFVIVHSPADLPSTPVSNDRGRSLDMPYPPTDSTRASFFECHEYSGCSLPTVEVDPPTPTTKSAREAFLKRAFPARKSSMKKLPLPLEEIHCPSHPRSDSVSTTAEVSIARQISISRRQRQLLIPIAPKLARQPRQPKLVKGVSTPAARKSHHLTLEDAGA